MREPLLFELPPPDQRGETKTRRLRYPIWTENKAKLIERYLYYFVLVTKHGTYIDGFAGPQDPDKPETWAAKLVLESEPKWLRHFYLYDSKAAQFQALVELREAQASLPGEVKRAIRVRKGDFNRLVDELLASSVIKETEATFCLLDQRTFECRWRTVQALAEYKKEGHKIELFYFLPNLWLNRALAAVQNEKVLVRWWGREDWTDLRRLTQDRRAEWFVNRFKEELCYRSVKPWPIFERRDGGSVMYYMIHATDHPKAPDLMRRAYEKAVHSKEPYDQLVFEFRT